MIPGLRERITQPNAQLGAMTKNEILAGIIVLTCIVVLSLRSFAPALNALDTTAIILISTLMFFITGIMDIEDLENAPGTSSCCFPAP